LSKAEALMWRNGIPTVPLTNADARVTTESPFARIQSER